MSSSAAIKSSESVFNFLIQFRSELSILFPCSRATLSNYNISRSVFLLARIATFFMWSSLSFPWTLPTCPPRACLVLKVLLQSLQEIGKSLVLSILKCLSGFSEKATFRLRFYRIGFSEIQSLHKTFSNHTILLTLSSFSGFGSSSSLNFGSIYFSSE